MRLKKHRLLLILASSISIFLFFISYQYYFYDSSVILIDEKWRRIIEKRQAEVNESIGCVDFLKKLEEKIKVPVLLIDMNVLENIGKHKCDQLKVYDTLIQVATDSRKDLNFIDRHIFEPLFFENNELRDYLEFATHPKRIIPKNFDTVKYGNLAVPRKPFRFRKFWENSRLIECANRTMNRKETGEKKRLDPILAAFELSRLRDLLIRYDMFPVISEGTLLGWYRECTIIPHTQDLDIHVIVEEFNPRFVDDMREGRSIFKLNRRLGKLDAMELTVSPRNGYRVYTDIFMMYQEKQKNGEDINWISGMCGDGERIRYRFPLFYPFCSADLLGHLVWTTCDPERIIKEEYGEKWFEDVPTNNYSWFESDKNVERNMEWFSSWEMRKITFQDDYGYH
uniref:Fukutin n=1 Tax=Caenorhabditis tropicalis TaxID=1561998 RepID=A0A1I7T5C2_9PELO